MQLDNGGGWHQSRAITASPLWEGATGITGSLASAKRRRQPFTLTFNIFSSSCSVVLCHTKGHAMKPHGRCLSAQWQSFSAFRKRRFHPFAPYCIDRVKSLRSRSLSGNMMIPIVSKLECNYKCRSPFIYTL